MTHTVPTQMTYLYAARRWVSWRYETREGKRTKVPYDSQGNRANVHSPAQIASAPNLKTEGMDGIGLVFLPEQPEKGIDLDACMDDDGTLLPWAAEVIKLLDSYTEISPSGIGAKVFFKGPKVISGDRKTVSWPSNREKNHEIAFYTRGYFTVTGNVYLDRPVREVDETTVRQVLSIIEKKREEKATNNSKNILTLEQYCHIKNKSTNVDIPPDLRKLIENGAQEGERSDQFHRAVCWLGDLGWTPNDINSLLAQHPGGIAEKYADRLPREVARCLSKRQEKNGNRDGIIDPSGTMVFGLRSFMSKMCDPEFVWRLVLRKRWIYALTANPGAGKTAIALYLTLMLAQGKTIHGKETMPCRVLYLCGENPDDVRMRFALLAKRNDWSIDQLDGRVYFTDRPFAIDQKPVREAFIANAEKHGPFDFCVIDTGPAHSSLDDENDNRAMHDLAIAMREASEQIGGPCTLALMHPVKNANRTNLLPRGGSSFTGSIDGVLCAWRDCGQIVELFPHPDKFRGEHFDPMHFELESIDHPTIKDNFGHPARGVIAKEIQALHDSHIANDFDAVMPGMDLDVLRVVKRIEEDGDWVGMSQSGPASNNLWRYRNHTAFPDYMNQPHMKRPVLKMVEELVQRGWLVKEARLPANKTGGKARDRVEGVWLSTEGHLALTKDRDLEVHV